MSIVEQLVEEVVEKVMEEEAILKLIKNVEMGDQVLKRIIELANTKLLSNEISRQIASIPDWIVLDISPTMMNKLKKDEKYIILFKTGPMHIVNVANIDDLYVFLEFLDSKLNERSEWIKKCYGPRAYKYVLLDGAIGVFYHLKKYEK